MLELEKIPTNAYFNSSKLIYILNKILANYLHGAESFFRANILSSAKEMSSLLM
jgi:hypothetical protein